MILQILKAAFELVLSTIFLTSVVLFEYFLYDEIKRTKEDEND